jgi:hypothetical protein
MTLHEASELLLFNAKIANILSCIPVFIGIFKWKYFKDFPLRWLFLYNLIYAMLNLFSAWFIDFATIHYDVLGPYLQKLNIYNTFFLEPFFYLSDIIFLSLFVRDSIQDSQIKKNMNIIRWTLIAFILLNTIFGEGYTEYQTIGSSVKNVFLLYISILLLRRIFYTSFQQKSYKIPYFWICLSILISVLGAGLIDFISNRMYNDTEIIYYKAHVVVDLFYDVSYIFMAIGCWLFPYHGKIR